LFFRIGENRGKTLAGILFVFLDQEHDPCDDPPKNQYSQAGQNQRACHDQNSTQREPMHGNEPFSVV